MRYTEEPMIQKGIEEIAELQSKVLNLNKLISITPEDDELAIEYLHTLYACVEKEHIMYVRLTLSENEHAEAKQFKEELDKKAKEAGIPDSMTIPQYCAQIKEEIKMKLSRFGQDLHDIDEDIFI